MKVLFDARYIRTDFHDGISRYSTELGNALSKQLPIEFIISDVDQKKFLPDNAKTIMIHAPTSPLEPLSSFVLNKFKPDVVFSPMQTIGGAGKKFKLILTTHDMIYYRHRTPPKSLSLGIRLGWRLYHATYAVERRVLNASNAVVTVSETSRQDMINAKLTKRSITVVPNAPQDLNDYARIDPKDNEDIHTNLIYMGSYMEYKNVETLIKSLEWLPGYTLHLLSRISPKRELELQTLLPKDAIVIYHRGVSDKEYAELLADKAILVSTSLDEGYGLPVAEALSFGTPTVISDIPIFREVAGEGSLYAIPTDPKDFAQKIRLLESRQIRENIIVLGRQHIARYSWDTSAKILKGLIEEVL